MVPLPALFHCITGLDAPLASLSADGCGRAMLLGRAALLGAAWWSATARQDVRGRRWLAATGAALVASLAAQGLFPVFVAVSLGAALRYRRAAVAGAAALGCTLILALLRTEPPLPDPFAETGPAPLETIRWSARDNAFWTRAWAERWSADEPLPGAGHLALARASWALGHDEQARELASRVAAGGPTPEVRQEATRALESWRARP